MQLVNTRMFITRWLATSLLCTITMSLYAQVPKYIFDDISGEEYNAKEFFVVNKPLESWLGSYGFGQSEGEWKLVVHNNNDSLIIQAWSGTWKKDPYTKTDIWARECVTFNKVTRDGNKFYFGKSWGQFVEYRDGKNVLNAVLLYDNPCFSTSIGRDSAIAGFSSGRAVTSGSSFDEEGYYELSSAIQPDTFFSGRSMQELKIMRNTILAKYGLIFQAGGEMDKYFRKKDWYQPSQKNVSDRLTTIEDRNIQTILRIERDLKALYQ